MLKNIKKYKKKVKIFLFLLVHLRDLWLMSRDLEVKHLTLYKSDDWHHGYAYFTGFVEGLRVFIKIDTKLFFLKNEVIAFEVLKDLIKIPKVIAYFRRNRFEAIVTEYIDAKTLTIKDLINAPNFISKILEIIKSINLRGVIHRDIKLKNFFLYQDDIWIFDFTFAVSLSPSIVFKELDLADRFEAKILNSIGDGYNPGHLIWNDFLSMRQILAEGLVTHPLLNESLRNSIKQYLEQFEIEHKYHTYSYQIYKNGCD